MRFALVIAVIFLSLIGCKKPAGCTDPSAINYDNDAVINDGSCEYPCEGCHGPHYIQGSINAHTILTADKIYTILGKAVVEPGVTLTIEPGTIIKGAQGTGSLASALIISKGATINACGTANQPIIFTSELDNITLGEISGTNLTSSDHGLWGGLVILGSAPISAADGDTESEAFLLATNELFNLYGGNDPMDNSGTLCYVSIRHTGANVGAGTELAGLSLGGVGSGTQISNVEVVAGIDDGIDIYGGTIDVTNAFVGFMGDDGIDVDQNYAGEISNFTVLFGTGDEGLEADGPEGTTYVDGVFSLMNGTFINVGTMSGHHHFKGNAPGQITNVAFDGFITFETAYNSSCTQLDTSSLKRLLDNPATLTFSNISRTQIEYQISGQNGCSVISAHQNAAEAATISGTPSGNGNTEIQWTWLHSNEFL